MSSRALCSKKAWISPRLPKCFKVGLQVSSGPLWTRSQVIPLIPRGKTKPNVALILTFLDSNSIALYTYTVSQQACQRGLAKSFFLNHTHSWWFQTGVSFTTVPNWPNKTTGWSVFQERVYVNEIWIYVCTVCVDTWHGISISSVCLCFLRGTMWQSFSGRRCNPLNNPWVDNHHTLICQVAVYSWLLRYRCLAKQSSKRRAPGPESAEVSHFTLLTQKANVNDDLTEKQTCT